MYPLSLTLKGFCGIRDGLGLDVLTLDLERLAGDAALVALAGPNGRGKSTILDNLHPFPTMPSRVTDLRRGVNDEAERAWMRRKGPFVCRPVRREMRSISRRPAGQPEPHA